MPFYRLAQKIFEFQFPLDEIALYAEKSASLSALLHYPAFPSEFIARAEGWIANANRTIELFREGENYLLKTAGGEYVVSTNGQSIAIKTESDLAQKDSEIILGPVIVFALALRGVWSLHCSAVMYKDNPFVFLGESGMGKSTLAAHLSEKEGWLLIADDILPARIKQSLRVFPHFPQLKFQPNEQPGVALPEELPLNIICVLNPLDPIEDPSLQKLSPNEAVKYTLKHTAGTRIFTPELLAAHLQFCAQVAEQTPVYRINYPHRKDALPIVQKILEDLC